MLEILIDNNAIEDLCDRHDYDIQLKKIKSLTNNGKLRIHFNLHPFYEQIEGVIDNNVFLKARHYVRESSNICNKCLILPPELYLRRSVSALADDNAIEEARFWFKVLAEFCKYESFKEFENSLSKLKEYCLKSKNQIFNSYKNVKEVFKDVQAKHKNINFRHGILENASLLEEIRKLIFEKLIERFNLKTIEKLYPSYIVFAKRLKSLEYLSNIFIFYDILLSEGREVQKSDYVDLEQIIYLDSCDYIITSDRKYLNLINDCQFADLNGRGMPLTMFLQNIDDSDFLMRKRAPFIMESLKLA